MVIAAMDSKLVKRLFLLFKPFTKKIVYIFICILVSSSISIVLPLLSKQIMDKGLLTKNFAVVIELSIVSLIFVFLDQGMGLIETYFSSYLNAVISYSLTKDAFKHTINLEMKYFNNSNITVIMNNIQMDIKNISRLTDKSMFYIVSSVFKIVGGIIGLFIIDWKLTALIILIIPFKYLLVKYLAKTKRKLMEQYMEYNNDYASWYGDTVGGVKDVKLWGIGRIKIGQFIKKQRKIVNTDIRFAMIDKINQLSESILFGIVTNTLYILGALMIFGGHLTIGGLFAFITYSVYVTVPISAIMNIGYSFSSIIPAARRFFDFMDMECESRNTRKKLLQVNDKEVHGEIRFENVSFSYDNKEQVLKNINFEIHSGENIAIVGGNGSGKSTILNLLFRLYNPQSGRILLDGINIQDIRLSDYRRLISSVRQDIYLFDASIKENIVLNDLHIDDFKLYKAAKESRAHDFINAFPEKYDSSVGCNGSNLSGGEKQKIAMARALARESKILVLDEATSNYDLESELQINKLIENKSDKRTVIMVTHKLEILKVVDRIVLLKNGTVDDCGTHDELYKKNAAYRDMFDKNGFIQKSVV